MTHQKNQKNSMRAKNKKYKEENKKKDSVMGEMEKIVETISLGAAVRAVNIS